MTAFEDAVALKLRDYNTDGVPASGRYSPDVADLRDLFLTVGPAANTIAEVTSFLQAASPADARTAVGLGASSGPTFASLALVGGLVVAASVLVADATNNRVGIGTASPSYLLDVNGTARATTLFVSSILRPTSDGTDNSSVIIGGGGAATTARGAVTAHYGNESSGAGSWQAFAGDVAGGSVQVYGAGNVDGVHRGFVAAYGGGTAEATSARVIAYGGAHASAAGNLYVAAGSAGVGYAYVQTTDGTDNRAFHLLGGGGLTNFSARGGYVSAYGNEASGFPGVVQLGGGDVADGGVRIVGAGGFDGAYRGYSVLFGGVSAATGARVLAFGNAHASSPGDLYMTAGNGNVFLNPTTSDGSDNKVVSIAAGGGYSSTRGAYLQMAGNDNGSIPGQMNVYGGDVADGGVRLYGAGSGDLNYRGASLVHGGASTATGGYLAVYGNAHATLAGRAVLSSGSAGDTYVVTGSADGSDNRAVYIGAGSAISNTRGGWISIGGNEHGSIAGEVTLTSGLSGGVTIQAGTSDTADNRYVRLAGGGGFAGNRGAQLFLGGNENGSLTGDARLIAGESGAVQIYVGTSSGADNRGVLIAGGGAVTDSSRGAYINVYGLNHATQPGRLLLVAGTGAAIYATGHIYATNDNTWTNGGPSNRWSLLYAVTGTINTSDAGEKRWRGGLSAAELRVARRMADGVGIYQWRDAVAAKGDAARLHIGLTAQAVARAYDAEGLDPAHYAAWCMDAVTLADGTLGVRQGLRYDQVGLFLAAANDARLNDHEARLEALEGMILKAG